MIKIILLTLGMVLCIVVIVSLTRFVISDFRDGSKDPLTYISIALVLEFIYLMYKLFTILMEG